jgi:Icc-related predicted phosphoesterase
VLAGVITSAEPDYPALGEVAMPQTKDVIRVAALGDLHYGKNSQGLLQPVFARFGELEAEVLVLCGDLTDYGLPEEAKALVRDLLGLVKVPIIAVLGNHDYESGAQTEVTSILRDGGVIVLDGDTYEIGTIGFAGVKGFAGGFGRGVLGPWGEQAVKLFVREAVDEALKLESALARLRTPHRVAILHYAPIQGTVEGEPQEIFPYLGCSRLEEPLTRYAVHAVVHGHAHNGAAEGRTSTGIPVFNVSLPLLRRQFPDRPFRILEIRLSPDERGQPSYAT